MLLKCGATIVVSLCNMIARILPRSISKEILTKGSKRRGSWSILHLDQNQNHNRVPQLNKSNRDQIHQLQQQLQSGELQLLRSSSKRTCRTGWPTESGRKHHGWWHQSKN